MTASEPSLVDQELLALRAEIATLIDRLGIAPLRTIRHFSKKELTRLSPDFQEAESRLKSIWNHLVARFEAGEHAAITEVHEFLLKKSDPRTPANVVPLPVTEPPQGSPSDLPSEPAQSPS